MLSIATCGAVRCRLFLLLLRNERHWCRQHFVSSRLYFQAPGLSSTTLGDEDDDEDDEDDDDDECALLAAYAR